MNFMCLVFFLTGFILKSVNGIGRLTNYVNNYWEVHLIFYWLFLANSSFEFWIIFTDMCPKPNYTSNALSRKSHVEDLKDEAIPNLFQALTAEPDPQERWLTFTFPVDFEISVFQPLLEKEFKYRTRKVFIYLF